MTVANFAARLTPTKLTTKAGIIDFGKDTDFDEKLRNVNKKVSLNKTKHVLVENEVNNLSEKIKLLSTKDYNFFLGRMHFTGDDGLKNMFVYQPAFSTLQLKKGLTIKELTIFNYVK